MLCYSMAKQWAVERNVKKVGPVNAQMKKKSYLCTFTCRHSVGIKI